jgi:hypothetical protein
VRRYIIEHPTRGVLVDIEYEPSRDEWVARWSVAKLRSEAWTFFSLEAANKEFRNLSAKLRLESYILNKNDNGWEKVNV